MIITAQTPATAHVGVWYSSFDPAPDSPAIGSSLQSPSLSKESRKKQAGTDAEIEEGPKWVSATTPLQISSGCMKKTEHLWNDLVLGAQLVSQQ